MSNSPVAEVRVVEDHASLRFDAGTCTHTRRRLIANTGGRPVDGYPVRIRVDRFPHFSRLSRLYHRQYPLRVADLGLTAWRGSGRVHPLAWTGVAATGSAFEVRLRFGEALAPGATTWIEYEHRVPRSHGGTCLQHAARHGTDHVSATLDVPATMTVTAPDPPVSRHLADGRSVSHWRHPGYHAEWTHPDWPTTRMRDAGILQYRDDAPALTGPAGDTDLGNTAQTADRLTRAADTVTTVHRFTNGMGLAAPQIGIDRRVVLLRAVDGTDTFLVDPRVVRQSGARVDLEGCLSFFDVRGAFPRPDSIDVTYRTLDGAERHRTFTGRAARDVAHEIDHLQGTVFVDRMTPRDSVVLSPELRKPT